MMERGFLVLVVGPSGAGKDTLLHQASARLAKDPGFYFPRRFITRPAEAGGEAHVPIDREDFDKGRLSNRFSLSWEAHGHCYALPGDTREAQASGVTVVANVSRTVIDTARRCHSPVRIVLVSARPDVLAARLAARGRETAIEIEGRLRRAGSYLPCGADIYPIDNSGPLDQAVDAFTTLLRYARHDRHRATERVAS